ncbi:hypothetical protein F0562_032268 [Nyssa sinensis]|uniref:Uncharacterized protein n=1 Tax=Nyssa sinensis TaxID=561372 RepID=A0A5J5AMB3_9ASTE|nr:hypothetical protein F0562_032268 [Nyssa sinensis]
MTMLRQCGAVENWGNWLYVCWCGYVAVQRRERQQQRITVAQQQSSRLRRLFTLLDIDSTQVTSLIEAECDDACPMQTANSSHRLLSKPVAGFEFLTTIEAAIVAAIGTAIAAPAAQLGTDLDG